MNSYADYHSILLTISQLDSLFAAHALSTIMLSLSPNQRIPTKEIFSLHMI